MRKPSESSSEEESSSEKKSGQEVLEGERPAEQLDVAVKAPSPEKTPAEMAELKASPFDEQERQQKVLETSRQKKDEKATGSRAARSRSRRRGRSSRSRRERRDKEKKDKGAKKEKKSEKPSKKDKERKSHKEKQKHRRSKSPERTKKDRGTVATQKNTETKDDEMVEVLDTSQKPAHPAMPPKNKGEAAQHGKAKGKTGKVPKKKCPHCHQWVTSTPAGQDQHRWLNELCLTWQVYNNMPWETRQKSESWDKACHMAKTLKEARQTRGPDEAWDNRSLPGTVSPMTLRSSHVVQHVEAPGVGKENPPAQSGGQSVAESVQPQEKPPAPQVVADSSKGTAGRREKKKRRRSSSSSSSSASAGRRKKGKNRVTINIR